MSRRTVKVYIGRVRHVFDRVFQEAGLTGDARRIVLAQRTETNEVLYRLKCTVEWREANMNLVMQPRLSNPPKLQSLCND